MKKTLQYWLPLALSITLLSGLLYVAVQQVYRQDANDPQVQVAEDVAKILEGGEDPTALSEQSQTDLRQSLAMFILVYDKDGKPVAGNGQLDGKQPDFPKSALDAAKDKQNRLSWQPTNDLRFAAVIQSYGGQTPGFVVAARSMRDIEKRIKTMTEMIAIGWAVTLVASFILAMLLMNWEQVRHRLRRKKAELKEEKTEQTPLTEEQK